MHLPFLLVGNEPSSKYTSVNAYIAQIVQISEQAGVPAIYLVLAGAVGASAIVYLIFGAGLVCNLVGFAYPAYASFKAIESEGKDDDTQWLTYWVVYAFFNVIETFADFIVQYFPIYFPIKFGLLIWLFSPNTMGADFVYKNFLRVYLLQHEAAIDHYKSQVDAVINEGVEASAQVAGDVQEMVEEAVQEAQPEEAPQEVVEESAPAPTEEAAPAE